MSQRKLARLLFVLGVTGVGPLLGILLAPKPAPPQVEYVEVPQQVIEREAPTIDMTVRRDPPPREEPAELDVVAVEPDSDEELASPATLPPTVAPALSALVSPAIPESTVSLPEPTAPAATKVPPVSTPSSARSVLVAQPVARPRTPTTASKPTALPPKAVVTATKSAAEIRAKVLRQRISSANRAIAILQKKLNDDKTNLDSHVQRQMAVMELQRARSESSYSLLAGSVFGSNTSRRRAMQLNTLQQLNDSANLESADTKAKIASYQKTAADLQAELDSLKDK